MSSEEQGLTHRKQDKDYGSVDAQQSQTEAQNGRPKLYRQDRSQVAHGLVHRQSEGELRRVAHDVFNSVNFAINASLVANMILTAAKAYAAYFSGSLAVLSSLVDSLLDLTSQGLFWYADRHAKVPDADYPAGRQRLEPIAVIISATLMGMAAIEVIQASVETLVQGLEGEKTDITLDEPMIIVLCSAVGIKFFLWLFCSRFTSSSPTAQALAQDHRNDVFSNTVAVVTSVIAAYNHDIWYIDPVGAIVISIYIAFSWLVTGKEQVQRLVGLRADDKFIEQIRKMADKHHPKMQGDIVRAYYFGKNYLVEVEVILPKDMSVKEAHDISLDLQYKVEGVEGVERAFVHVDYCARDYDEHRDPTSQ